MPKKAKAKAKVNKRTPTAPKKSKKIPEFDRKMNKNFSHNTRGDTTSNPTNVSRKQDLEPGRYIITPDTGEFVLKKPRADKGKERGKNDGRSRRNSSFDISSSMFDRQSTQEGLRAKAGGVRALGNTLASSVGAEPLGGWNGSASSILSGGAKSNRSGGIREDITKRKNELGIKVLKLDHPDSNPENWTRGMLDNLAIERFMKKFGATRDNAEQNWVSRTEQQKVRYRKEEQTSAILEYQQRRKQLEGDIDEIAGLEGDYDEALFEEQGGAGYTLGPTPSTARISAEDAPERNRKAFSVKIDMMREFGQLDDNTAEGKGKLFALIDEGINSGSLTQATQQSGPIERKERGTPLTGQTLTGRQKEILTYPYQQAGRQLELKELRTQEILRKERILAQQAKIDKDFNTDPRPKVQQLREYVRDEYVEAKNKIHADREIARQEPIKLYEGLRAIGEEQERAKAVKNEKLRARRQAGIDAGNLASNFNRRQQATEGVGGDLLDSVLNRMTFPAETETQENRREVGRVERRATGADIFKSQDAVKREDVGDEAYNRDVRNTFRKMKQTAVTKNLEFKLKNEDPRFMSDDDLEAKAKGVSQNLRDKERKQVTEDKWEDVIRKANDRPVLKLPQPQPQPEPEADSSSDDESFSTAQQEEPTDESDFEEDETKDRNRLVANIQLKRYRDANHFGNKGITPQRVEAIKNRDRLVANIKAKGSTQKAPPPPPRPIKKPDAPPIPPRNVIPLQERRLPLAPERLPITAGRYQRGSNREFLSDKEVSQLDSDRIRLAQIKSELNEKYGFRRAQFDTRSKADRASKDGDIAIKLTSLRLTAEERDRIERLIKEALQLSDRVGKATVKGSQLKKKKK